MSTNLEDIPTDLCGLVLQQDATCAAICRLQDQAYEVGFQRGRRMAFETVAELLESVDRLLLAGAPMYEIRQQFLQASVAARGGV
jgi:hypothetical protein